MPDISFFTKTTNSHDSSEKQTPKFGYFSFYSTIWQPNINIESTNHTKHFCQHRAVRSLPLSKLTKKCSFACKPFVDPSRHSAWTSWRSLKECSQHILWTTKRKDTDDSRILNLKIYGASLWLDLWVPIHAAFSSILRTFLPS